MNDDLRLIVGVDEYPAPGSLTIIVSRRPFLMNASATAPVPPPPVITTAGGKEYPEPGSVTVMLESILVDVNWALIGKVISGR